MEGDRAPVAEGSQAVYFRSVPGRYYAVERARGVEGGWELRGTRVASATQTRFVVENAENDPVAFYRAVALP